MGKGDVLGWAIILGGLGIAGFFGYQGLKSIMGDGLFSSTTTFGGEKVKTDIFGNVPAGTQQAVISSWAAGLSEQSAQVAANQAGMSVYGPEVEAAYAAYGKELQEYNEAAQAYEAGIKWGVWGSPSSQTLLLQQEMLKEYGEAMTAGDAYSKVRAEWMAQYA